MAYFYLKLTNVLKISWWEERLTSEETFNQLLFLEWEKNTFCLQVKKFTKESSTQCSILNCYKTIYLLY